MKTSSFFFELPEDRIAQYPSGEHGNSRLMLLDRRTGEREHRFISELPDVLAQRFSQPLLVFNNSRVRKARLPGRSLESGKTIMFLLVDRTDALTWRVLAEKSRRKKAGSRYTFADGREAKIAAPEDGGADGFLRLRFDAPIDDAWLDVYGRVPLPPYITRPDETADTERYQTVYADRNAGSALGPGASSAAPTAGLHFTGELLEALRNAGVETAFVTLHVGLGTFLPVRAENLEDHVIHEEAYRIGEEAARLVNRAHAEGRPVIAVGTTSARTLESAWKDGGVQAGEGRTALFLYPSCRFHVIDGLLTNFHTPCSTLLMMTAAFVEAAPNAREGRGEGRSVMLESYAEAIRAGYRFFSYGDAMLIY